MVVIDIVFLVNHSDLFLSKWVLVFVKVETPPGCKKHGKFSGNVTGRGLRLFRRLARVKEF